MTQEQIVDDIILNELETKHKGSKELILSKTTKEGRRTAILSILDDDRKLFERYKNIVKSEEVCGHYAEEIVQVLREYVYVADVEKKQFGEVMTPLTLVNEMLDKLPNEVWSNPNIKWLDPCNGVGTFPSVVIKRLMDGLKEIIIDDCERYRHIIEHMIYVCELQPKNMFLYHCAFDREDDHELNTFYGSFLDNEFNEHMINVWGVEKFDIIIGNPPYQEEGSEGDNKYYLAFSKKSTLLLNNCGSLLFLTPKSILNNITRVSKNRTFFNKFYNLKFVSVDCPSKYFKVGSTFVYFLLTNEDYQNLTKIHFVNQDNNEEIVDVKLEEGQMIPSISTQMDFNILKKLTSIDNNFDFKYMKKINGNTTIRFRYTTKSLKYTSKQVSITQDDVFCFPIIHKINKKNPYPGQLCYSSEELIDWDKPKVTICRTGYLSPSFDNGNYGITDNMTYCLVENENEAKNLIFLLESNVRKYLEFQYSRSHGDRMETTVFLMKKINLIGVENINDNIIYSLFNLTLEEMKHLEKTIKK
jgi:hypothetical protein